MDCENKRLYCQRICPHVLIILAWRCLLSYVSDSVLMLLLLLISSSQQGSLKLSVAVPFFKVAFSLFSWYSSYCEQDPWHFFNEVLDDTIGHSSCQMFPPFWSLAPFLTPFDTYVLCRFRKKNWDKLVEKSHLYSLFLLPFLVLTAPAQIARTGKGSKQNSGYFCTVYRCICLW